MLEFQSNKLLGTVKRQAKSQKFCLEVEHSSPRTVRGFSVVRDLHENLDHTMMKILKLLFLIFKHKYLEFNLF